MQSDRLSHIRILCVLLLLLTGCQGSGPGGGSPGNAPGGTARIHIQIGSDTAAQSGTTGSTTGARRQRVSGIPPEVTTITVRVTTDGQDLPNSPFDIPLETATISVVIAADVEHLLTVDARNQRGDSIFHGQATANVRAGIDTVVPIALGAREVLRLVATQRVAALTGGEVVVSDPQSAVQGLRLLIPPGALDRDTTLTITEANNPQNVPALLSQVGSIVDILPDGLLFAVPVTLTFPYNATLASNLGFGETSLRVWRYNALAGQWAPVSEQDVDTANNVIRAQLTALSFYTVAGPPPPGSANRPPVANDQFVTIRDTGSSPLNRGEVSL
ncbi:MAG: hypothetical protein AB7N91_10320 [Candidatus Tectimicrobiota bacterium]